MKFAFTLLILFLHLNIYSQELDLLNKPVTKQDLLNDLEVAYHKILHKHVNPYWKIDSLNYEKEYQRIRIGLQKSSKQNYIVEDLLINVQELLSFTGDIHANLFHIRGETNCRLFPIYFKKFSTTKDYEYRINSTASSNKNLLGSKIIKIGNYTIPEIEEHLKRIFPKNFPESKYYLTRLALRNASILHGIGVIENAYKTPMTFELSNGKLLTDTIVTYTNKEMKELKLDLYDDLLKERPLMTQNHDLYYWFKYLPESNTVYFRNTALANKGGLNTVEFSKKLYAFIDSVKAQKLIIDLRDNGGGNGFLSIPFLTDLKTSRVNRQGKLFCLMNGITFSAAIIFFNQLDGKTPVVTIGEPPADAPNFCSDFIKDTLPSTKLLFPISTLEIMNTFEYDPRKSYHPEVSCADFTWEEYNSNKDPMISKALNYSDERKPILAENNRSILGRYKYNDVKSALLEERDRVVYFYIPGEIETPLYPDKNPSIFHTNMKELKIHSLHGKIELNIQGTSIKTLPKIPMTELTPFENMSEINCAQTVSYYKKLKAAKNRILYLESMNLCLDAYRMYLIDKNSVRTNCILQLNEELNHNGPFFSEYLRGLLKQ